MVIDFNGISLNHLREGCMDTARARHADAQHAKRALLHSQQVMCHWCTACAACMACNELLHHRHDTYTWPAPSHYKVPHVNPLCCA